MIYLINIIVFTFNMKHNLYPSLHSHIHVQVILFFLSVSHSVSFTNGAIFHIKGKSNFYPTCVAVGIFVSFIYRQFHLIYLININ